VANIGDNAASVSKGLSMLHTAGCAASTTPFAGSLEENRAVGSHAQGAVTDVFVASWLNEHWMLHAQPMLQDGYPFFAMHCLSKGDVTNWRAPS
jgi:hypothetical protein